MKTMKYAQQENWSETVPVNGNSGNGFEHMRNYGASQDIPPTDVDTPISSSYNSHYAIDETEVEEDVTQVEEDFDYISGWMVCISGPQKGKDFRLRSGGYNKIGRNPSFAVALTDTKISREFSMWVCFDPLTKSYLTGAKAGGNLVYLNGKLLPPESTYELKRNDKIRVGESELMFIPLCDENFQWE